MKMNLPNKLTILRLILVPVFMAVMLIPCFVDLKYVPYVIFQLLGAALFIGASVTDLLDGRIARKYGLVTDLGKFLDPLADKFMVIGALLCIFFANRHIRSLSVICFVALVVVIFRELAVTSIRLIASSKKGVVIAANILGKIKTVTQIVAVSAAIIEPVLISFFRNVPAWAINFPPITVTAMAVMMFFTIYSGANYIAGGWQYVKDDNE